MDIIQVVLTSLLSAAALFIIAKIIGHKQISQLDIFDYITGITIGSIAAELATELEQPWKPLVAMVVYGGVTVLLSFLSSKLPRARKFISGTPTILLDNGKLYRRNLQKAKIDLSEFMVMCREQGYFDLNDIQTAVFEYDGRLSILPASDKRPATPSDLNLSPPTAHIATEVIMDGRVLGDNLRRLGLDVNWLQKQLATQHVRRADEIFLAVCDQNHRLTLFPLEH